MNQPETEQSNQPAPRSRRRIIVMSLFVAGAVVLGVVVWSLIASRFRDNSKTLVYYRVRKSNLPITVTERGNLESQQEITIVCELENLGGDRSGNYGTQILMIIPQRHGGEKGRPARRI